MRTGMVEQSDLWTPADRHDEMILILKSWEMLAQSGKNQRDSAEVTFNIDLKGRKATTARLSPRMQTAESETNIHS